MIDLLRTWWPVLLLVYVPSLVASIMRIVVTRAYRRLDKSHPDDLEHIAGTWLSHEIMRQGLRGYVRQIVTDNDAKLSRDMFHPLASVIQLEAETHFKRDPMYWAVAAHELGHARVHQNFPILARLTIVALYVKHVLLALAAALVLGNVMFALPHVTELAFSLFVAASILHLVRLLDELAASRYAMQSLRASQYMSWSHMRSARKLLAIAFSTYLVAFLARVLVLTQWPLVEALTRHPLVPPVAQLTTIGTILAAAATLVLVAGIGLRLVTALRPDVPRVDRIGALDELFRVIERLVLLGFILLVWNTSAATNHAYYVILAFCHAQAQALTLLMVPMRILDVLLIDRIVRRFVVDPVHRTPELRRDQFAGRAQIKRGNATLADLLERPTLPIEYRIAQLLQFSYIPLLIAFWLS